MNNRLLTRPAFTKQPFHYVFVDVCPPTQSETIDIMASSLSDVVAVASSIRGSSRILKFGLIALGSHHAEHLFTLQTLKSNFVKISTAIHEMRLLVAGEASDMSVQLPFDHTSLKQAFSEAMFQFSKECQISQNTSNEIPQLQITVISQEQESILIDRIEQALQTTDLQNIRKLQVLTVLSSKENKSTETVEAEAAMCSSPSIVSVTSSSNSSLQNKRDLVDSTCIYCDSHTFDAFFKTWLHDSTTDKEHLQLHLSPVNSGDKRNQDTVIMCDIHEAILDPRAFIYSNRYHIVTDPSVSHGLLANADMSNRDLPVYEMEVVNLVQNGSLCESVIYGLPLLLRPTFCWKKEWSELETNRQKFLSVMQVLRERDCALLVRMKPLAKNVTVSQKEQSPNGYFIIFASERVATLLIKPVACREILMPPADVQFDGDLVPLSIKSSIESLLNSLTCTENFNPIDYQSGLFPSLKVSLKNVRSTTTHLNCPGRKTVQEEFVKASNFRS